MVGDYAAPYQDLGTFIPGCPIPPLALLIALAKKGIVARPLQPRLSDLAAGRMMSLFRGPREGKQ